LGRKAGIFVKRPDLLGHLIEEGQKPDTGVKMDTLDVVDQMSEILLAGAETTSGTIVSFFLEMTRNVEVKAKLLRSLPARSPQDPLLDAKKVRSDPRYAYLEACLKETLRLHPIASEMGRTTGKKSVVIANHTLPPHTVVSVSYRKLHVDPEFWPEPKRFWPERWLEPTNGQAAEAPPPEYAFFS
jgi:cytochrome P450